MDRIKQICKVSLKEKWVAILAVIVLIMLMVPLVLLCFYATPYYDDYIHIRLPKAGIIQYGGFKGWLWGVLYAVESQYYAWQGTYSTQLIVSANPIILGEVFYGYAVVTVFVLFVISVFTAVLMLTKRLLNMNRAERYIMAVGVTVSLFLFIHTAQEGLYWYNGEVHYTFMHGLMLLLIAVIVEIFWTRTGLQSAFLMIIASFLSIAIAGSNFVTILQGLLLFLTLIVLGIIARKKKTFFLILPMICYTVGFYKNVSAPGNAVRGSYFVGCGALESILYSFKSAGEQFWNFTGFEMIVVLLLVFPVIINAVARMDFSFCYPGIVTLYSVCLYATGFTSSYYALGNAGVGRTWVAIKFTLQLLLFINEIYWLGWLAKKINLSPVKHYCFYYVMLGCVMFLLLKTSENPGADFSSYGAYYFLRSGEAQKYYCEYEARVKQIQNGGSVIEVEPYTVMPWFLCMGDLSTDYTASQNNALAQWYNKEAIYVKE